MCSNGAHQFCESVWRRLARSSARTLVLLNNGQIRTLKSYQTEQHHTEFDLV